MLNVRYRTLTLTIISDSIENAEAEADARAKEFFIDRPYDVYEASYTNIGQNINGKSSYQAVFDVRELYDIH